MKYPKAKINLFNIDGNAYSIMGAATKALKKAGASQNEIDQFYKECKSETYDNLIQTVADWCNIINDEKEQDND